MKRIARSRPFLSCLCVSLCALACFAASDEALVGDSQRRGPLAFQVGGWSELNSTTSGFDSEAVLKVGGPEDANSLATFYYTGTGAYPWQRSNSKVYLSNSKNGVSLVKINGHVPPAGANTADIETELSYEPPLLNSPRELKAGGTWEAQSALGGHTLIDWHNPTMQTYDGELSGSSRIRGRVTGKETVSVPAGRFECYVIETERTETYSYSSGWTGGGAATVVSTTSDRRWFSPELGQAVKSKSTASWVYTSGGKDSPARVTGSMVLARYQLEKPPEPLAAAARTEPRNALAKKITSDVDAPKYSAPLDPDKFALVIGISKYRDIPEAEFAERDAQAVKRHLLAMGYPEENIITLTGDHATKSALEDKLEKWLPMNVGDKSTVFVYYSGHGAPDPESKAAFLVPWDGEPESLAATAFPLSRFYKDLNALAAKQVLAALDSCFSGAGGRSVLAKGAKPLITKIDTSVPAGGKLVVFTASGGEQISGTLEDQGHGAFTYYFLKGLNGAAPSPRRPDHVTIGSLYDYLSRTVNASAHRREREQNPQLLPPALVNSPIEVR